jgi:hypothetical protein
VEVEGKQGMIRDRKERAPGRAVDEVHAQTELQADVGGWHKALPARTSSKPATPSRRPALKLIGGLWHVRWVRGWWFEERSE